MSHRFKPTETFWESFCDLTASQKESTRRAWRIFRRSSFDPRLRADKIHRLSARNGRTIYFTRLRFSSPRGKVWLSVMCSASRLWWASRSSYETVCCKRSHWPVTFLSDNYDGGHLRKWKTHTAATVAVARKIACAAD